VTELAHHAHVLFCVGATLGCIPAILTAVYVYFGLRRRADDLVAYVGVQIPSDENKSSTDYSTASVIPPGDLGHHLKARFDQANRMPDYFVAAASFYVVYGVLLYWAFFAWGLALTGSTLSSTPALWEAVKLGGTGAFGATLAAVWHLYWRVVRLDLVPRTFFQLSARLLASPFLAIVLAKLPGDAGGFAAPIIAFAAGAFGDEALRRLKAVGYKALNIVGGDASLSLQYIQGISGDDELRLREEGICDVEHMAVCSVVTLATNTGYSLQRIVDWKDQAYLCTYVGKQIDAWRALLFRGALDVCDMALPIYMGPDRAALVTSLATKLNVAAPVIERLIISIYNDRQVYQLWILSKAFSPEGTSRYATDWSVSGSSPHSGQVATPPSDTGDRRPPTVNAPAADADAGADAGALAQPA
jgi:hypothetical protein